VFAGAFGLALLATPSCRSWLRNWRWWVWSPLAVLIAAPWYLYVARHAGGTFAEQFLWFEVLSRIAHAPHGHTGPPGYYLLLSLAGLLPWTPLVPGALILAVQRRKQEPLARLLLIWMAIPWLVLELIASKLPHYILPCYVPLMILLAWMLEEMLRAARPWAALPLVEKRVWRLWAGVMIVLGAGMIVAAAVQWDPRWGWPVVVTGLVLSSGFAVAWRLLRHSLGRALAVAVISCVAFHLAVGWYLLPALEPFRLSRSLARAINALAEPGEPIALCGFQEPSTFFYLGNSGQEMDRHALGDLAGDGTGPAWLVISERELNKLDEGLAAEIRSRIVGGPVSGYNYVKMERERIWIVRSGALSR
jgi:4-amino-4-deoxy-L-arabinose transferase-like glycosyltransferase